MKVKTDQKKLRVFYGVFFLIILAVEAVIALYVHDDVIRPYVGDMLVVFVVYAAVRVVYPDRIRHLWLYVFLFAALVELLQYFDFVELLGLGSNRVARIVLGSTADLKDVACYGVGCAILGIWDHKRLTGK